MKKFIYLILITTLSFTLTNCRKRGNKNLNNQSQSALNSSIQTTYSVQEVQETELSANLKISGVLEGINDIKLISEVNGKVISVHKELGDSVKKGEKIASIDNEDLRLKLEQTKAALDAQAANYQSEKIQFDINTKLYDKKAISETEYILAESKLKAAKASYDGAAANYKIAAKNLKESEFSAPISGKITALNIEIGDFVSNGTAVCAIVNNEKMKLEIGVGEKIINKLEKDDDINFTVKSTKQKINGKIAGIGIKPGNDNFNYPVKIIIDNPKDAIPGQLVTGEIQTKTEGKVITIPKEYLHTHYDNDFVFILNSEHKIEKRKIILEEKTNQLNILKSGLKEGEFIISTDNGKLQAGISVNPQQITSTKNISADLEV